MKTGKKFLCILLILVMAVFLFTGCGKKSGGGGDTTLEGTWRLVKQVERSEIYKYDEEGNFLSKEDENEPEETTFPDEADPDEAEDSDGTGMIMIIQPYFQFKNNKTTDYVYMKLEIPSEMEDSFDELVEIMPIFGELRDGAFIKSDAADYSATDKKIVITRIEYNEETGETSEVKEEYSYVIDGKKMTMIEERETFSFEDLDGTRNVGKKITTMDLEKVKDTVFKGATIIEEDELPGMDNDD